MKIRIGKTFICQSFSAVRKEIKTIWHHCRQATYLWFQQKKCDNGYKDFVAPNGKKQFQGDIITLNNDGDGGAGIAYYQPYQMALDSHVTALIPLVPMNRHILLFVAMCITKQRERFGHGYSLNSNRLRSFKLMLPLNQDGTAPDWAFMEAYMKQKEQQILKPTIERLCKQLIINNILGGG